jgi:hypothetical protein
MAIMHNAPRVDNHKQNICCHKIKTKYGRIASEKQRGDFINS